jgi:hypothetical protein
MIILSRRAGIGVRSDGVIVRSVLGRKQWIPWSDVEQFTEIRTPRNRSGHMIAVICLGRKPLYTLGCWFDKTRKQSRIENMHQVVGALEAERLAALQEARTADLDETLLRRLKFRGGRWAPAAAAESGHIEQSAIHYLGPAPGEQPSAEASRGNVPFSRASSQPETLPIQPL